MIFLSKQFNMFPFMQNLLCQHVFEHGNTNQKIPLTNLMTTIYFITHQKTTACRLLKEVFMHYLCKKKS